MPIFFEKKRVRYAVSNVDEINMKKGSKHTEISIGKLIGRAVSGKAREKMSLSQIERYRNIEERNKISQSLIKYYSTHKNSCKGEKHWNWKGGVSFKYEQREKGDIEWRKAIFKRDNYLCCKCNQCGNELNAHHIFNFADFPKLRRELSNGVTLCKKCHKDFHYLYGVKRNNLEQLLEFLGDD